ERDVVARLRDVAALKAGQLLKVVSSAIEALLLDRLRRDGSRNRRSFLQRLRSANGRHTEDSGVAIAALSPVDRKRQTAKIGAVDDENLRRGGLVTDSRGDDRIFA